MTYRLKVNQQWKIVLAVILCPAFFVLVFIPTMLHFKDLPDWLVLAASFALVGVSIAATLLVVMRWLTVDCEIRMDERRFHFRLLRETPFMHIHEFTCNWSAIENVSRNENSQNYTVFYIIQFREPKLSLYLSGSPGAGEPAAFWDDLNGYVNRYNDNSIRPEMQIKHTGFYETGWAKVLAFLALGLLGLSVYSLITQPGSENRWRALAFTAYALPWLISYYMSRKKQGG